MRYRVLGRTGLRVSELGIGGHEYRRWLNPQHFPGKRDMDEFLRTQPQRNSLIERAVDAGVNYFDTTLPEEAESLGLALKALGRRRDVHVAAMLVLLFRQLEASPRTRWRQIVSEGVEERLKLLQIDHIDVFNIHMPENNYSRDRLRITLEVLEEMKKQGKIGAIGASSHDPRFLAEIIRKYDCFDSVMVRYNYHLQEARDTIFPLCKALDIGVVVMKPFSWPYYGVSFTNFCSREKVSVKPAQASLRWILGSPEVSTVVMGVNSLSELEEDLATLGEEGRVDEKVLSGCLDTAQSSRGKEKLEELVRDPAIDIRSYAKRAIESGSKA